MDGTSASVKRDGEMNKQFLDNWRTQLRKGLLELCALNAISGERLYGYDIVRRLRKIDGLVISEGTIYPILSRFKREGLVETSLEESNQGPARKYYQLSPLGQESLERMNQTWELVLRGVSDVRSGKGSD